MMNVQTGTEDCDSSPVCFSKRIRINRPIQNLIISVLDTCVSFSEESFHRPTQLPLSKSTTKDKV